MSKVHLSIAVMLAAGLSNPALAAENTAPFPTNVRDDIAIPATQEVLQRPASKKAKKILFLLSSVGLNDANVRQLVGTVDSRIDDGYLRFSENALPGDAGKVKLRYRLSGGIDPLLSNSDGHGIQRMELNYRPTEDSRWEALATTKYVVVNYRIPLDKF